MNPSAQARRIAGLDLLRALAIVSVLVAHYPKTGSGVFTRMLNFGWTGVDLFFVLSGYLIGGQVFAGLASGEEMSLGTFYGRRLLRTLPNYYLILAIYVILSLSAATASPSPIWKFLSFTQNMGIPNAFTPSWSLCVEEQFYLAFPMIVLVLARRRSPRLVVLALASILALGLILRTAIWFACRPDRLPSASALAAYMANLYFPTYCRLDGITCGVALAAVKCFRPAIWQRLTARPNALLAGSGLFFTASILAFWTRYTLFCSTLGFTLISASFTLLTAHVLSGRGLIGSRNIPGTATVALLSYAIYLTHSLAIECAERLVTAWGVTVQSAPGVAVATTLIVVFASVLYYVVERPCLRLRDQFFGKKKSPRWEKALVPIAQAGN